MTALSGIVIGVLWACSARSPDPPAGGAPPAPDPTPAASFPHLPPVEPGRADRSICTLDDTLQPLLASSQPSGSVRVRQEAGSTVEELTVEGGMPVRLLQGGCAHYGVVLTFSVIDEPADPLAATLAVFEQLGVASGEIALHSCMLAAPRPPPPSFAHGDAWCSLGVQPVEGGYLVIAGYDFPM